MLRTTMRGLVTNRLFTLGIMVCVGFPICGQSPQSQPVELDKLSKQVDQMVKRIVNWGEPMNSSGAKAELRETKRGEREGKLFVAYELYVTGAPRDKFYTLFQFPITSAEPMVALRDVSFETDGRLCLKKGKDCSNPVQLAFLPGKGEPFRFVVMSKDGKTRAAAMIVPDPIVGTDQGCRVEVIRVTPKFEGALFLGKGFRPGEEIKFSSNSAGEILEGTTRKVDSNGEFVQVLAPFVKGKDKGTDEVTFKASTCAPVVKYDWGT